MGNIVKGILGAFVTFLLTVAMAVGVTFMSTDSYDDASDAVRLDFNGAAASADEVMLDLEDAWSALFEWQLVLFVVGFVIALIFLIRTATATAATPKDRRRFKPMWVILLLVSFAVAVATWFFLVVSPEAAYALAFGNYALVVASSFVLFLIAFYVSTAFFVSSLFAPSVPLSAQIRGA